MSSDVLRSRECYFAIFAYPNGHISLGPLVHISTNIVLTAKVRCFASNWKYSYLVENGLYLLGEMYLYEIFQYDDYSTKIPISIL